MSRPSAARFVPIAVVLCTAAAILVLVAPPASALSAPTLSTSTVQRGESFTISGTGCWDPENDPYTEGRSGWFVSVMSGAFVGSATTDEWSGGAWSVTVDVGGHLGPGVYPVRTSCFLGDDSGWQDYPTVSVTVVGEPLPPKWWEPGGGGPPIAGPAPDGASPPARQPTPQPTQQPKPRTAPVGTASPSAAPPPIPEAPAAAPTTASAVFAAAPGCADCELLTGDQPLTAGAHLTLTYSGFQPDEQVALVMRSTPVELGTFTADATGTVTARITLPASAEAGTHTLTLSGPVTGDQVVSFRLAAAPEERETVAAPEEKAVASPTSPAWAWPLGTGGAAVVLLVAGGWFYSRRRSARPAARQRPESPAQPTETPISEPIA